MNIPKSPFLVAGLVFSPGLLAQSPLLQQGTLGNVTDIADSNLGLDVRFTYEIDPGDLDGDGDQDLLLCHFYLFNPPLDASSGPFEPVLGSGGLRLYDNMTIGAMGVSPAPFVGPPFPGNNPAFHYDHMLGGLTDETARIVWGGSGFAPSVRDAEIADLNGDGLADIVLSCGVGVNPSFIVDRWSSVPESHIAQNRILIQQSNGTFVDETATRLPIQATNTCGVAVGDLNGDQQPDIVFGEYGPSFSGRHNIVLLNDAAGSGVFTQLTPNPFAVKQNPGAAADVELFDLDGNGSLDIVVANANPNRASVVTTVGGVFVLDPTSADTRRNEIWMNSGSAQFRLIVPPDPPGVPSLSSPWPYNLPGFWNDTRAVSIGDIDLDGDGDIFFANNGWKGAGPDDMTNVVGGPHGQAPQLLLNMGNHQAGAGGMVLNDYLDVTYLSLPWGAGLGSPDGGWRPWKDFELTPAGSDIGAPSDLVLIPNPAVTSPSPDGYPDLLVALGPWAANDVWINSGNWDVHLHPSGVWYSSGRFFRGAQPVLPNWASLPTDTPWFVQQLAPYTIQGGNWVGLTMFNSINLYTHDIDWVDLDGDGALDVVTADGDPHRGEINGVYFQRGLDRGFRWIGPSDDGAVLPNVNTVLAYGVNAHDLDNDNDLDIVVPGAPTALVLENQGGLQNGTPGRFVERTFQDTGGLLPFTGKNPLYAPILTEAVALFDADGDDYPEMLFGGYPPYGSTGEAFSLTDAPQWHLYDPSYFIPVPGILTLALPTPIHCNFYVKQTAPGVFEDVTKVLDNGTPWLDQNGRIYENICDRMRSADLDNDGDLDVVTGYRPPVATLHPHLFDPVTNPFDVDVLDPNLWQIGLSLWMNDGAGHLRDEALERLGPYVALDTDNVWNVIRWDLMEAIAFGDVDSDGDLDFFTGSTDRNGGAATGLNRLWINMGGDQKNEPGGPWRAGQFRIADAVQGIDWGGTSAFGPANATGAHNSISIEACDIDGDDDVDFAMVGTQDRLGPLAGTMGAVLLINDGTGQFTRNDFGGVLVDAIINGATATESEVHQALAMGDFDGDGDTDCVAMNSGGRVNRLYENTTPQTSPSSPLSFEDRTALGIVPAFGQGTEDGISWVPAWSQSIALAEDLDGDGLHDAYVANHERTTQDDVFFSTAPDPIGPAITRLIPKTGSVSGGTLRILGANLLNVTSVAFEQQGTSVAVPPTSTSDKEVVVTMPASAPLGTVSVVVEYANGTRSTRLLGAHLNAAPVATPLPGFGIVVFAVADADGVADIDPSTAFIVQQQAGGGEILHASPAFAIVGGLMFFGLPAGVVPVVGDTYTLEVGDQRVAFAIASMAF